MLEVAPSVAQPDPEPADSEERRRAATALGDCCLVEAGAGTGKTTVLVERVLNLLRHGHASIEQIAAITFTEKAGGQLRLRLRAKLGAAVAELRAKLAQDPANAALAGELARLEAARRGLAVASIGTIHSFAADLLRARPVEAGIDPGFVVLDELESRLLRDRVWERWLEEELAKEAPALERALLLGITLEQVRDLADALDAQRDLEPDLAGAAWPDAAALFDRLAAALEELLALLPSCTSTADRGYLAIRRLEEDVARMRALGGDRLLAYLVRDLAVKEEGNQQNWQPKEHCRRQKAICAELKQQVADFQQRARTAALADLLEWLKGFRQALAEAREGRGGLDFHDLLLRARDLLRDFPDVRADLQRRYRYLLVDEFQDTDPLQAEIVFYLTGEHLETRRWEEARPAAGRLFLVGDPKQSIYRFRRADVTLYRRAAAALRGNGGLHLRITQNFRSVAEIVDWVNTAVARAMGAAGRLQPDYEPIQAWRRAAGGPPRVLQLVLPAEMQGEKLPARVRRQHEATAIANLLREAREAGWPVERGEGKSSGLDWGDCALLFRAYTDMEVYEEALRAAGIPYRVEGGKAFFDRDEVRALRLALRALDDPGDQRALVATLRSPLFFGCSDDDLLLFRADGGQWNYLRDCPEGHPAIACAWERLRRLHRQRQRLGPARLVDALLRESGAVELARCLEHGDQAAANLLKVELLARDFEAAGGRTLRAFVRHLEELARIEAPEEEAPLGEEGEEGGPVHLTTIHRAKGLEYPLVALVNCGAGSRRESKVVADHERGALHLACGEASQRFATPGFEEALALEREHAAAEEGRLLYVAATRARDYLIVPLFAPEKQSLLAELAAVVQAADGPAPPGVATLDAGPLLTPRPAAPPAPPLRPDPPPLAEALQGRAAWATRRRESGSADPGEAAPRARGREVDTTPPAS